MASTNAKRFPIGAFPLLIILALFIVWAGGYIWRTSFPVGGTRYFCLFDDAMISMRYAQNIADGHGAVWNPGGDRVEGFTNPLWTFIMALAHFIDLPQNLRCLPIQLLGLALLAATILCVYRIGFRLSGGSVACAAGGAFLTGFYLPLCTWGLQGMEVSLLVFLIHAALLLLLRDLDVGRVSMKPFALLGLAFLTRPDAIVPYAALLFFAALSCREERFAMLAKGIGLLACLVATVTLARYGYYGEVLPNTYFLKMTGLSPALRITRGLHVFADTAAAIAGPLAVAVLYAALNMRARGVALLSVTIAAQAAYSIYVGGDAWELWRHYPNRYLCIVMPGVFILFALALQRLLKTFFSAKSLPAAPRLRLLRQACFVCFMLAAWFAFHGVYRPGEARVFVRQMFGHRLQPLHAPDISDNVIAALWLRAACPPGTSVAVIWAGALPYFSGLNAIDLFGKCDRRIARTASHARRWQSFIPGHDKYDFSYSIDTLAPDVVAIRRPDFNQQHGAYQKVWQVGRLIIYARRSEQELIRSLLAVAGNAERDYRSLSRHWGARKRASGPKPSSRRGRGGRQPQHDNHGAGKAPLP